MKTFSEKRSQALASFEEISSISRPRGAEIHINRLSEWRERILRILMWLILIVGTPMLIVNVRGFIEVGNWVFLGFAFIAYAFLFIVMLLGSRTTYIFRTLSILVITYLFTILAFQNYGLSGDGRIWLLFFVVFTTIMLGLRPGLIATGFSIISFMILGYLINTGIMPLQIEMIRPYSTDPQQWITTGLMLLLTSVILSTSIGLLIQGLERSLNELQDSFEASEKLSSEISREHDNLERRSMDLERRVLQIRTAAEISRSIGTILNPNELLEHVTELVKERFNLYYVGIFFVDENRRFAVLQAGTGEAGRNMLAEEHKLSVGGSSMVGWATARGQSRVSLDVGQEEIRFRNPHLPLTRSELALPLIIGKQAVGALSIQSAEAYAFDDDDIIVLQSIADSVAIAFENARLFQQFEDSLQEIRLLSREYFGERWSDVFYKEEKQLSFAADTASTSDDPAAEVTIPLVLRGEQVIGNISMQTDLADLSPEDQEFIDAVANQAALALENARLLDEANRRIEREQALIELTNKFALNLDFDTLLKTVVRELGSLPMVSDASIHIKPPQESGILNHSEPVFEEELMSSPPDIEE